MIMIIMIHGSIDELRLDVSQNHVGAYMNGTIYIYIHHFNISSRSIVNGKSMHLQRRHDLGNCTA